MAELAYGLAVITLEKLGSVSRKNLSLVFGMKKDLKKLKEMTLHLASVLEKAEKKQANNEHDLKMWLVRLKDIFDDAIDVLDEFECEALRRQVVKEYGSYGEKVSRFFSRANPVAFRFSIVYKVKEIRHRLHEITENMAKFDLINTRLKIDEERSHKYDQMTHSFVDPLDIIGRDEDKAAVIDMLLSQDDHDNDDRYSVVPIVGIAGLGKTALAKLVYNDSEVGKKFDEKIWVRVTRNFDVSRLLRDILKETKTKDDINSMSPQQVQTSLRGNVQGKKLLLVFDDVWNEDRTKWLELTEFLAASAKGSKVIVTARSTKISSIMTRTKPYHLEALSDEFSESLFFTCAFGDEKLAERNPRLREIGKMIAGKCAGIPLLLKTLGSLLYSKDEDEWKHVRDHEIWELEQEEGRYLHALHLTYNTMSPSLKQCFAYYRIFPNFSSMMALDLISIWMALGILYARKKNMALEDIGQLQLKELEASSFIQCDDSVDEEDIMLDFEFFRSYKMHDLVYDLACFVGSGKSDTTRHLRVPFDQESLASAKISKKLLSLYLDDSFTDDDVTESVLSTCIAKMRYLRVFDLQDLSFEVLPSSIRTLKHLRYLNLSNNGVIKRLPDSICELQSLQTLLLGGYEELEELSKDIRKLVSLITLAITTKQVRFPENGIGLLKSIRTLIIVDCINLRFLPHDLRSCTTLHTFVLVGCGELDLECGSDETNVELSLRRIYIDGLPKITGFPQWLKEASGTLQILTISDCANLDILPEWLAALTSLEKLTIKECPKLSSLPEGNLCLASLTHLKIDSPSSAFYERYQPKTGRGWAAISHIPNIHFGSPQESVSSSQSQSQS